MKIGTHEPKVSAEAATAGSARPAVVPRQGGPSSAEPSASATVALSASAYLATSVPADPTFDAAKVERIAHAIRTGQFKVDAGAIADQLISNAQELLSRTAR